MDTNAIANNVVKGFGATVNVIATTPDGTRQALQAAASLARGDSGRVVVLKLEPAPGDELSVRRLSVSTSELRRLADSYDPHALVLPCVCRRTRDVVQLFGARALVVIGGATRLWWPTAEQRLARELARLGCRVVFAHVSRRQLAPDFTSSDDCEFDDFGRANAGRATHTQEGGSWR